MTGRYYVDQGLYKTSLHWLSSRANSGFVIFAKKAGRIGKMNLPALCNSRKNLRN